MSTHFLAGVAKNCFIILYISSSYIWLFIFKAWNLKLSMQFHSFNCIFVFCRPACIAVYKSKDPNKMNYVFCLLGLLKWEYYSCHDVTVLFWEHAIKFRRLTLVNIFTFCKCLRLSSQSFAMIITCLL